MRKFLLAFTLLAACTQVPATPPAVVPPATAAPLPSLDTQSQALWNAYQLAVYDSAVYQQWNVRKLRPLVPDTDGTVLVTTLTTYDPGQAPTITTRGEGMWVTGVPEVQTICRAFRGDVMIQLRELLGLPPSDPPNSKPKLFLTLRANAADIFRPALDPRTATSYPCDVSGGVLPADCGNAFPSTATPFHFQWMATASFNLHQVPGGYPWTHLGYTYNWKPGADRYGTSEYVIKAGSTASVVSKMSPEAYCKP
jgi:hypothetical protein